MAKKQTKKAVAKVATPKKEIPKDFRVVIYNSIGQVERNKLVRGSKEDAEKVADTLKVNLRKGKGGKIEILEA